MPNDDVAGLRDFAAVLLDPAILRIRITAVILGDPGMQYRFSPDKRWLAYARRRQRRRGDSGPAHGRGATGVPERGGTAALGSSL